MHAPPRRIARRENGSGLDVVWPDRSVFLSAEALRRACPCAVCKDRRRSGLPIEPEGARVERVAPVGRYAVTLVFADGHATGIYDWETLAAVPPASPR